MTTATRPRNGFGGFNRGQKTSRAQTLEMRKVKDRSRVLSFLVAQFRSEPVKLTRKPDVIHGALWVADYDTPVAVSRTAPASSRHVCIIRGNEVQEIG